MPIQDVKDAIKGLMEKTIDPEQIKALSSLNAQVEQVEKEENEALAKHAELQKAYREVVINANFPTPSKPNEKAPGEEHNEELSFDDALNKAIEETLKPKN